MKISPAKIDEAARAIAEEYHGRPVSDEYLSKPATGGHMFINLARAAAIAFGLEVEDAESS